MRQVRDAEGVERVGRSPGPGRNRIMVHFDIEKTNLVMTNLIFFFVIL